MAESQSTAASAEQYAAPRVETLVDSAVPERRALTVDGIYIPDFDAFDPIQIRKFALISFTALPGENGVELQNVTRLDEEGNPKPAPASAGLLKRWAAEAIDAFGIPIPPEGRMLQLDPTYLLGPQRLPRYSSWHRDGELGAMTLFETSTTLMLDQEAQDVYAALSQERRFGEGMGFSELKLTELIGKPYDYIADHTVRPEPNQTVYMGPEVMHSSPGAAAREDRRGILCFILPVRGQVS